MTDPITHLVFDLGGVVIELRGTPIRNEWCGTEQTPEQLWEKWLTSNAPRQFESGKIDQQTFAAMIVEELSLSISEAEFIDYFTRWPVGPFPGVKQLISDLRPRYKTALFSNSNAVHWERKMNEMELGSVFDNHFASHLMGYVKPDKEAFEHVIAGLGVNAANIVFFDDNKMNVEAAKVSGMQARHVVGFDQLKAALAEFSE